MRLLLVLLALLSGLSLTEVSASAARAQVVGSATGTVIVAAQERKAGAAPAQVRRPAGEARLALVQPLPASAPVRILGISIPDRPRE